MKQGFMIIGKCLGSRQLQSVDKYAGEVRFKNEIGIGLTRPDGFGGSTQIEIMVSIRKKELFTNDLITHVKSLIGKQVMISVFPTAWQFNGKTGITYLYTDESSIEEVKI